MRLFYRLVFFLALISISLSLTSFVEAHSLSIGVLVVDRDTFNPIEGAYVVLKGPVNFSSTTKKDGKVEFKGVPNGTYEIDVYHNLYEAERERIVLEGSSEGKLVAIVLKRKILEVRVIAESMPMGRPVPNATVILEGPLDEVGGWKLSTYKGLTDEDGEATFRLIAGVYEVSADAPDHKNIGKFKRLLLEERSLSVLLLPTASLASLDPSLVVAIGWLLGVTNYYLGWTFIALPILHRGIKRAGLAMVEDGATYSILMLAFGTIFIFVRFLWALFYGTGVSNWDAYVPLFKFCFDNLMNSAGLMGMVGTLSATFPFLAGILQPIGQSASWILQTNAILIGFGMFVLYNWPLFLSIGVLLYGIPVRIGRYAGAGMISFAIVYFIGLPFLPTFINTFLGASVLAIEQAFSELPASYIRNLAFIGDWIERATIQVASFYLSALIFPIVYMIILGAIVVGLAQALGGWAIFRAPIR